MVRNMNPLLGVEQYEDNVKTIKWTDSDNDGVTDFDEIKRFGTKPELPDSDSDKVNDKDEIYSYTIMEKSLLNLTGSYVMKNIDLTQMRIIAGIEREYMADVDGDGLRAELDRDSDDDGLLDGDDPEPYKANVVGDSLGVNELPEDVVLYARKQLNVNDGTICDNQGTTYCTYASEGVETDYGMIMGARVSAANLYAKNKVLIRNNPNNIFVVNYFGSSDLASIRPDGRVVIDRHFNSWEWPWKLDIVLPFFDEGDSVLTVHRGDTCFLKDNDHFNKLKIEAGGLAYLPVGNVYVGDLQLDAGGKIGFVDESRNAVLNVKGKIMWKSDFFYKAKQGFSYRSVAENFMLNYSGFDKVFIETNWYGTIIAPNAGIVLGQTQKKDLYGQVYADKITVHQRSNIVNVPFVREKEQMEYVFMGKIDKKKKGSL